MRANLLEADCSSCFGLCCTATGFEKSADFAITKPAGTACTNLLDDFHCRIHEDLGVTGFSGCVAFDCHGAGQRIAQQTYGGVSWREAPHSRAEMFKAFAVMRGLHELLWLLEEADTLRPDRTLRELADRIDAEASRPGEQLVGVIVERWQREANPLLTGVSEAVRTPLGPDHRGADLVGADLRGRDLRRGSLRGALLMGADLRGADLALVDFTGADLRGARLHGADVSDALFLSRMQRASARWDS